jgi:mitochondrial fission protein ELM1
MPTLWLVDAYRSGERGQLAALADALAWPCEVKQLIYRKLALRSSLFGGSDLQGVQPADRSVLQPPWPDLVLSCGLRNEPVCRWIRDQSGGRTKIVHIARPWADPRHFDLVVTTPQYRIPQRDNVLHNRLTLHQVDAVRLADAAANWRDRFAHLPQPFTAVILGGDSGPFTLGPRSAARLARDASARARASGGSLLVTTSSRTSPAAVRALAESLDVPHYLHQSKPNDANNPYLGILGLASELIVTADSIAMLSEACATGKQVWMFDLGGMQAATGSDDFRLGGMLYAGLMRWGWQRLTRDITLVHANLVRDGLAQWLGSLPGESAPMIETDLERATRRVRALFGEFDAL